MPEKTKPTKEQSQLLATKFKLPFNVAEAIVAKTTKAGLDPLIFCNNLQ